MSFTALTQQIVRRFLQTIVVFDDEAYFQSPGEALIKSADVTEPSPRGEAPTPIPTEKNVGTGCDAPSAAAAEVVKSESQADIESEIELADDKRVSPKNHQLDAKLLIDSFAALGHVCAIIAPARGENLIEAVVKTGLNADVIVLDWKIGGDDGTAAIEVVKKITDADKKQGSRLRLVAIYTGEPQLQGCFDSMKQKLPFLSELSPDQFKLGHENLRIVFLRKGDGGSAVSDTTVTEKNLPERIVREFSDFAGGLLPNAVMASVAAVRENTHQLLQRFSKDLDGAYLGHRMLLPKPEDAEAFLFELVGDEIKSLLEEPRMHAQVAGLEVLKLYVEEFHGGDATRAIKVSKDIGNANLKRPISKEHIVEVLEKGMRSIQQAWDWGGKEHLHKRMHPLFHNSNDDGAKAYSRFARLSCFHRERAIALSLDDFKPLLTLGTVLKDADGRFLLCLQPVCDCIRLTCNVSQRFLFGEFDQNVDSFDLVANDGAADVKLSFSVSPFRLSSIGFDPANLTEVYGSRDDGGFRFVSADGKNFSWIGELRRLVAQRFASRFSEQIARIGLEEFEWQRLYAGD
jgi:response regulator receiver domain-containing protein